MSLEAPRRNQIEALIAQIFDLEANVSQIDDELAQIMAAKASVQSEIDALEKQVALADHHLAQESPPNHCATPSLLQRALGSVTQLSRTFRTTFALPTGNVTDTEKKIVLAGCAVVLLGLAATVGFVMTQKSPANAQDKSEAQAPVSSNELAEDITRAEQAIRKFYRSDSLGDILTSIREPKALEPTLEAYYRDRDFIPSEITIAHSQRVHRFDQSFILSVVRLPSVSIDRQVAVELKPDKALVDWELAVNNQRYLWRTASLTQEAIQIRAEVSPSDYYNYSFTEDQWKCFQLHLPEIDTPHYGYVRRRGAKALELDSLISRKAPEALQAVLVVGLSDKDQSYAQMEIHNLSHHQWLLPNDQLPIGRMHPGPEPKLLTFTDS